MRIGLFTDTYFPQVSGVATSIRTLKTQLEKMGHTVFIFTTTDRDVDRYEDWQIVRIPSVPFFAFKDRRVAYRGFSKALEIAKQYKLDIIHTQTEFSLGLLGIAIARELRIPVVHTYHTQYEDYVRYIAKGMVIRPSMVKYIVRGFMSDLDGVICPSEIVYDLLVDYKIARNYFLLRIRAQGVYSGQVDNGAVLCAFYRAHLLIDCDARKVSDVLVAAGQRIKEGGFSAVLVAGKGKKMTHCVTSPISMLAASSARMVRT